MIEAIPQLSVAVAVPREVMVAVFAQGVVNDKLSHFKALLTDVPTIFRYAVFAGAVYVIVGNEVHVELL